VKFEVLSSRTATPKDTTDLDNGSHTAVVPVVVRKNPWYSKYVLTEVDTASAVAISSPYM